MSNIIVAVVVNECLALFSFKLMMEVALTARAFKFHDAWLELFHSSGICKNGWP